MVKTIRLISTLSDEHVDSLAGTYLDQQHFDTLIGQEDSDVLKPDGTPLLIFRSKALPADVCRTAYPALRTAANQSGNNRSTVAGGSYAKVKRDGTVSNVRHAPLTNGIIGYFDRTSRWPYCRTTAYTQHELAGWAEILPFVQEANSVFRRECADRFAAQNLVAQQTSRDYVIQGTAFTTVTVNRNVRTAVHKDSGDLPEGFGVMSTLSAGNYAGCYLVFPKYRVAVDMRTRDVLLADVHEWHGNTPLIGVEGEFERISTVMYYRSNMRYCGTPAQELERAKNRRPGDRLNDGP